MTIPKRDVSPEAIEEARRLYEHTSVPNQHIADLLGISRSTLNVRIGHWGWKRRKDRLAATTAAPVPGVAPAETAPAAAEVDGPLSRRLLIARLVARMESEIAAVERLVARAGLNAGRTGADAERAARTLAILVRAMRELAAIARDEDEDAGDASANDMFRDADAYRRELAETLERVLAERAA
ncbi:hypothetical protein [Ancylobacter defluvii]|uniref:Homeodomain-like domain-containing protein n=1 Tax=Ancylobacter defluvii TaxID=1282440 RepID=A0A9W6JZ04_9HYPH|nr:hypothetical protein [Ancylobacter defluvii]MBS7589316.1 hypothetical protein [Ancylobacter defluvii]GLK84929.1 hypothetical protein GCM10017653_29990 [Ancylobacter defluvii]